MKHILFFCGPFALVIAVGCGGETKPGPAPTTNTSTAKPAPAETPSQPVSPATSSVGTQPSPIVSHFDPAPSESAADVSQARKWVAQLADPAEEIRLEADQRLMESGSAAIPALLLGLKDKSPETRRAVAYFLLEKFPSSDARIGSALRDALADEDRKVRQLALAAVKRMPPEAIVLAVPKIASLLDSTREEPINRADAARLLGRLQSDARDALPELVKAASSDPSEKVRAGALYSITKVAEPSDAVPVLIKSLRNDADGAVRLVAATGLGRLDSAAAPAASDLAAALDDRDDKVRRAASDALAGLESAAVLPLVARFDSQNPRTRELAVFTLGRLGPAARPAISAIEKRTKDDDAAVRKMAEKVLESLQAQ